MYDRKVSEHFDRICRNIPIGGISVKIAGKDRDKWTNEVVYRQNVVQKSQNDKRLIRFNYSMEFSRLVCRGGRKRVKGSRILEVAQTAEGRRNSEVEML